MKEYRNKLDDRIAELTKERDYVKFLEDTLSLTRNQLLIICMNNGGELRGLEYDNLSVYETDKIEFGLGYDSLSIRYNGALIKNWEDLPKKEKQ